MKDKRITCIQCEKPFVFSVAEQERFLASGFANPKRCPECRKKKLKGVEVNENGITKSGRNAYSGAINMNSMRGNRNNLLQKRAPG